MLPLLLLADMQSQEARRSRGDACVEGLLGTGQQHGPLQLEIDALSDATAVLASAPEVQTTQGLVTALDRQHDHEPWTATLACGRRLTAERVLLVPGAVLRSPPAALTAAMAAEHVRSIPLDTLLGQPPPLEPAAPTAGQEGPGSSAAATVAAAVSEGSIGRCVVVGAAHSGCLAAKGLLAAGASKVLLLSHRPDFHFTLDRPGGYQKYRGTGLLGPTADWARALPPAVEFRQWPRELDNDSQSWRYEFVRSNFHRYVSTHMERKNDDFTKINSGQTTCSKGNSYSNLFVTTLGSFSVRKISMRWSLR